MPFKLSLVADVRQWLKGTADVEQSLDKLADGLDDLARDTKTNADKAADSLEREFSDAFDKVKTEGRQASRRMGDDFKDGTKEAGEGLNEFKDEANSTAREAAASFSGSFDDVADGIQEVLANALAGFGPIGAAAGLVAAAGIGLVVSGLQDSADKAAEAKDRVLDLADAIADAGGDPSAVRWAEQLRDTMKQIVDTKEWYEFWQNSPVDKLSDWSRKAKEFGVSMSDVMKSQAGDADALARVNDTLNRTIADQNEAYRQSTDLNGSQDDAYRRAAEAATQFRDAIAGGAQEVSDAAKWQQEYADATRDLSNAQADAAEASSTFSDTLTNNLSVADEGLNDFVHKGKLNLEEWTNELKARARETQAVQDFTVTIAPRLSPEALANFAQLPTDTQAQIAKAFRDGGKKDRKRIIQNLEAEAKVTSVQLDTSSAQKKADSTPIDVPTTVAKAGAVKGAQEAADDAQKVANRESNRIEFKTKINDDGLQAAVNRAAAGIRPPTIWVNVKAKKDVP